MNPQDNDDATRARQGESTGRMRYVLAYSLSGVIVSMFLAWWLLVR